MKKNLLIIATAALLQLYFFSSCNFGESSTDNSMYADTVAIAKGEKYFAEKCSSCHNFSQDGIGPELGGVTKDQSMEWIRNFITNPKKAIDSGDTTAQKLFKHYKALMPSFDYLSPSEIDALLAFINTKPKHVRMAVKEDTNNIKNPIPDSIKTSGLVADIDSITQIPASSDQMPLTRITKLGYQPDNGALYVLDLRGKLYKLQNGKPEVYMDMAKLESKFINQPGLATGFGSFAFHPDFSKNGLIYTTHTEPAASAKADFSYPDSIPVVMQWVLTEWKTNPVTFPFSGKGRELFRIDMPNGIHGMQEVTFNRQAKPGDEDYGLLYIGIGDGGSTEIGHALVSPIPNRIWGSIIRIDPLGNNSLHGKYGIPLNNPFVRNAVKNAVPEIYAYGFRNPHRISWSTSGKLLVVNIGQSNIESVNLVLPGHFYGWPIREGTFEERFFNEVGKIYPLPSNDSIYHVTYPVAQLNHNESTAITGGFEYRGNAIPLLKGKYLFGDIGSGKLFYVNMKDIVLGKQATIQKWNIAMHGMPTSIAKLCHNDRVDLRFGMDSKGELYLTTKEDGKVYKLVSAHLKN
ncbi:MAG TPA: PQQ-dependent sugar dehydrogenase [Chitinophagaceae bacterium]|nr:PQQ-dependent sugar dehydrogenase [Chitinophagaceae bacterium]